MNKFHKISGWCLLLIMALLPVCPIANAQQRAYYSIHFASFQNLENANRQVNSLQEKGKMVFWKKTDVPGKGLFYRVYLGRFRLREDAVAFWEKLNRIGAVSYFGVHRFDETYPAQEVKTPLAPPIVPEPADEHKPAETTVKTRFLDHRDGTVTDTRTNLMWIKNGWRLDFLSAVTWSEAVAKCKQFKLGGYADWRLPTLDEWKSLIDTNNENPALIEPSPFENIIGHMPYWTQTEYTYGRNYAPQTLGSMETYTVMLYSGSINHQNKNKLAFILPVRSID